MEVLTRAGYEWVAGTTVSNFIGYLIPVTIILVGIVGVFVYIQLFKPGVVGIISVCVILLVATISMFVARDVYSSYYEPTELQNSEESLFYIGEEGTNSSLLYIGMEE